MLPSGDKKLLLKSKLFSVLDICHKLRYTKPIIKLWINLHMQNNDLNNQKENNLIEKPSENRTLTDVNDNSTFDKNVFYDEEYDKNDNISNVIIEDMATHTELEKKPKNTFSMRPTLGHFRNVIIPVICYSGVCGIVVGILVGLYTKFANLLTEWSKDIYTLVRSNPLWTPLFLFGLVVIALICHFLLKATPECKGSGVPRTEGVLRGILTFRWLRVLLTTILSSLLTYFGGISLGSEGPSIQIGATTAQGACRVLKCRMAWTRYIMSAGAGTGLAVAFNAPLTGIIFVIEEVQKKVTPMLLLTAGCSVTIGTLVSNAISKLWGGTGYLFDFGAFPDKFALQNIWMLVILGIIIGLSSVGFNWLILNSQKIVPKKLPQWFKLVFTFLLCGCVGLALVDTVGGGHSLIMNIGNGNYIWWMLLVLLLVKLILIPVSFNSGATGGLFIPMLTIGALLGGLFGNLFQMAGLETSLYKLLIVISMSAFFGASVRTPITAMVLVMEVTGSFHSFLFTGITIFIATIVAELFKQPPLYDALLERNVEEEREGKSQKQISFKVTVEHNSFADGKLIKDLLWPPECAVKTISKKDEQLIASAETKLEGGDLLLIKAKTYDPDATMEYVERLLNE